MKKFKNVVLYILAAVFMIVAKGVKHVNTKSVERIVNKSTQVTEKIVHKTAANANWKLGGFQATRNITRSNAKTPSNIRTSSCIICNGTGRIRNSNGYIYSCSRCNGTGRIFIKSK